MVTSKRFQPNMTNDPQAREWWIKLDINARKKRRGNSIAFVVGNLKMTSKVRLAAYEEVPRDFKCDAQLFSQAGWDLW